MAMSTRMKVINPTDQEKETGVNPGFWIAIVMAMRPHQWTKNLFIFAPLLFGMKLTEGAAILNAVIAFAVFCLLASSLYIFNDWIDLEEDRKHPDKRNRPLSSGAISASAALVAAAGLAVTGFALSIVIIGPAFTAVAALYFSLTVSYCVLLKQLVILDAMTIAAGFVIRIVGGAVAVNVAPSHWLIVCAYLLALFLAFSKRKQELLTLSDRAGEHRKALAEYSVTFLGHGNIILIGASIVCYALYTVAPETMEKFGTDSLIYGTVFVIYGMLRYMLLMENSDNGGDPSKMLLRDRPLLATVVGWGVYNAIVVYYSQISANILN